MPATDQLRDARMSDYRPIDSAELARTLFRANLAGARVGLTSVCSAHPLVLRTACESARDAGQVALIEATCNQVNQEGGYTGMTPGDFVARARRAATAAGLPAARLLPVSYTHLTLPTIYSV